MWDAENRLVMASNGATVVTFGYDGMGRRAWKASGGVTNRFVYDGWNLVEEVRRQGAEVSTNAYVWGLDLSGTLQGAGGVGGLLCAISPSTLDPRTRFFSQDANGNITDVVADDGMPIATHVYGPFGAESRGASTDPSPFAFSSKYYDEETGLYDYGFRYYDPELGRWLNRDPLGESGGVNLTGFCGNEPLSGVDVLGLRAYGKDYTGSIDPTWDWVVDCDQESVDRVYATLAANDRHIYNPGLDNTLEYQTKNAELLEKILGVPVTRVWNKSLDQWGDDLSRSGVGIGNALANAGGKVDFVVAGYGKLQLPGLGGVDQAVRETRQAYSAALSSVGRNGKVYGWMHSEGAIHGARVVNGMSKEATTYLTINTLGGAEHDFVEGVDVTHWATRNTNGNVDPVPKFAAGTWRPQSLLLVGYIPFVRQIVLHPQQVRIVANATRVTTDYSTFGSDQYVHGFPTYAKYVVLPWAKTYFKANACGATGR